MKKIMMTRLSVCSLGVSCNEMIDTLMLLVVLVLLGLFSIQVLNSGMLFPLLLNC